MDENPYKSPDSQPGQRFPLELLLVLIAALIASGVPGPHHAILDATAPFVAAIGITIGIGGLFLLGIKRLI